MVAFFKPNGFNRVNEYDSIDEKPSMVHKSFCTNSPMCSVCLRFLSLTAVIAGFIGCGPGSAEHSLADETLVQNSGKPSTKFFDPAPPRVETAPSTDKPEVRSYDRVTFHAAPKPLTEEAITHNWTDFLGPTHNAISTETKLLKNWPDDGPQLVWELSKGDGYASPAIQDEFLVFLHRIENEVLVECLNPETGRQHWQFRFPSQYRDRYGYSDGPRASPVIDEDRVYIYGAEGKLFCLRLQTGRMIWQRNIGVEFDVPQDFFGIATTPLIEGKILIINVGAPGGPCVAAFDKLTGKMDWGAGDKWGPSYATPVPATIHGRRRILVFAGGDSTPPTGGLLSLDPENGRIDFEFPWRSRSYESVNASCPVVVGNQVFISASYKAGSALVNVDDEFQASPAWTTKKVGTHWNTAVYRDGHLYAFDGRNEPDASLVCLDVKTGQVVWREEPEWEETVTANGRLQRLTLSTLRGSLLWVDGDFLCLGEYGHLLWLHLTPQGYEELDRAWLFFARQTWALPVLSRGLLYITQNERDVIGRTSPRLLCYDLRATVTD